MRNKHTWIAAVSSAAILGSLLLAAPAVAETTGSVSAFASSSQPKPGMRTYISNVRASTTEQMKGARQEMKDNQEQFRTTMQGVRASTTEAIRETQKQFHSFLSDLRSDVPAASTTHAALKQAVKERNEELKEIKGSAKFQIASAQAVRIDNRLNIAIDRLTQLTNRIQSRIEKITANGGTAPKAQASLDSARAHIGAAVSAAKAFAAVILNTNASSTPAQLKDAAQTATKTVKDELQSAQKALKDSLNQLKTEAATTSAATSSAQ